MTVSEKVAHLIARSERARLANELKKLLQAYLPTIFDSDTPGEIESKVAAISTEDRLEKPLKAIAKQLVYLDQILYGKTPLQMVTSDLRDAFYNCQELERTHNRWEIFKDWLKSLWPRR